MTDRELMQKWLQPGAIVPVDVNTVRILIDALRERLAQPEQKPVAWRYRGNLHEFDPSDWAEGPVTPLYTTPLRREWVGLTEEDWLALGCKTSEEIRVGLAIQAKLKEKNGRVDSFLRRLLDPEDLGHAVSHEVRQKVRELL